MFNLLAYIWAIGWARVFYKVGVKLFIIEKTYLICVKAIVPLLIKLFADDHLKIFKVEKVFWPNLAYFQFPVHFHKEMTSSKYK